MRRTAWMLALAMVGAATLSAQQTRRLEASPSTASSTLVDAEASRLGMRTAGDAAVKVRLTSGRDAAGRATGVDHATFATAEEAARYYRYRLAKAHRPAAACEPAKGCRTEADNADGSVTVFWIEGVEFYAVSAGARDEALALEREHRQGPKR